MTFVKLCRYVCVVVLFSWTIAPVYSQQVMVGTKAPQFTLAGINQPQVRLSDYEGKVILLDFWATWCTPCQTEVPHFVAFQSTYGKQGFQVIGVSMDDTPEPVRKFYAKFKMNYPVAMGTARAAQAYGGVLGLPLAYLIAKDGRIVKRYDSSADLDSMELEIKRLLEEKSATPTN